MRTLRRLLAVIGVLAAVTLASAAPALAHPLGNFTVNRYARVEVSGDVVRVYYVLDQAEIPTFQDRDALDADRDAFIRDRSADIARHLTLQVDGAHVALEPAHTELTLPEGQGDLATLHLAIRFEAPLPAHDSGQELDIVFRDDNETERIGWREIVVVARGGADLVTSDAPATDESRELTDYPADMLGTPLDRTEAHFTFTPGTDTVAPADFITPGAAPERAGDGFVGLVNRDDVAPLALLGLLAIGFVFGAGHALAPGHGKTVMGAYLVGTRGRPIDAVLLGVIVSAMHTASVLVLAGALYAINRSTPVDRIYPALSIASGVVVIGFGATLLASRVRTYRRIQARGFVPVVTAHAGAGVAVAGLTVHTSNDHEPIRTPRHDIDLDHGHRHGPGGHTHELPADVPPLSRRGLVLLATAGGLLPSPSAVLMLLAAFSAGRAALGLGLVAAFSIGLATTLTAIGLGLVLGGRVVDQRMRRRKIVKLLPLGSAAAIMLVGTVITTQALVHL